MIRITLKINKYNSYENLITDIGVKYIFSS